MLRVKKWTILITMLFLSAIYLPSQIPKANAVCETKPAPFRPYGPHVENLQIQVYPSLIQEVSTFFAGGSAGLDVGDFGTSPTCPDPGTDIRFSLPVAGAGGQQYPVLNCWGDAITRQTSTAGIYEYWSGLGYNNFFSILNMRQIPGCPSSPAFVPGGGNPDLLRWGLQPGTSSLSPFYASSDAELRILRMVYDTLLISNANDPNQSIDWMTVSHALTVLGGNTIIIFRLRNDISWQNSGLTVAANDVCQSILAYKNVPHSFTFGSSTLTSLIDCTPLPGNPRFTIAGNCVALGTCGAMLRDIGGLPIIPLQIWDSNADGVICGAVASGPCTGLAGGLGGQDTSTLAGFDPMKASFIGSGPWKCNNLQNGLIGGSCVQAMGSGPCPGATCVLGSQTLVSGDKVLLSANHNYMRGPSNSQGFSLQKESWADQNNDGRVDILDLSNIAFFFGAPNSYWVHPQYSCFPTQTVVDICALSATAVFFDEGLTNPFGGGGTNPCLMLTDMDCQIDPYGAGLPPGPGGPSVVYYQTTDTFRTQLLLLSGAPAITLFSATACKSPLTTVTITTCTPSATTGTFSIIGPTITIKWAVPLAPGNTFRISISYNGQQVYAPLIGVSL